MAAVCMWNRADSDTRTASDSSHAANNARPSYSSEELKNKVM